MTTTLTTRLLDYIERRLWDAQDARLAAAGWEVTRLGRWRRSYRHPARPLRLSTRHPVGVGLGGGSPR